MSDWRRDTARTAPDFSLKARSATPGRSAFPFRRVARLALRPARFLAFGHLLLRHLGRVPAVVQAQVVLAGVAAQPGVDHAASEAAVFRRHEAVVDANLLEQAGVDEIRLAVAGDVADLQVQVLAGRVQAVGGVHAVQLEQVLVGAGAVEGQVFHVQRAPVLRTVGAGIDAHRRVAGDQRCQVAVGTGRLGDLFAGVGPLAGLFAVDAHRVQAVGREQIGLVHVDDVAARTVRFQGQAGSSQQVVQRQQRRVLARSAGAVLPATAAGGNEISRPAWRPSASSASPRGWEGRLYVAGRAAGCA